MDTTLEQLFDATRNYVETLENGIGKNPARWQQMLQKAVDQGCFLKIEFGIGGGGFVDAKLLLVSPNGEAVPLVMMQEPEDEND